MAGEDISPRLLSEGFYNGKLPGSLAPIVSGRRVISESDLPAILEALHRGRRKTALTVGQFCERCISDKAASQAVIAMRGNSLGLAARKVANYLRQGEEAGIVFRWVFGPREAHKFANKPQI